MTNKFIIQIKKDTLNWSNYKKQFTNWKSAVKVYNVKTQEYLYEYKRIIELDDNNNIIKIYD